MEISMNPLGKECLKLFCIHVWYYMEISMEPFWQGMFATTVFCIRVWYHMEISMESFWQRMFETILYTCMVLHGNFHVSFWQEAIVVKS